MSESESFLCFHPVADHFVEVFLRPVYHVGYCRHQRLPCVCERIVYSRRHLRIDLAADEVAFLEAFQCLRQHLLRAVEHQSAQFVEAQDARFAAIEHVEHEQRPLVAETADDMPDRTKHVFAPYFIFLYFSHNSAKVTKSYHRYCR